MTSFWIGFALGIAAAASLGALAVITLDEWSHRQ